MLIATSVFGVEELWCLEWEMDVVSALWGPHPRYLPNRNRFVPLHRT